MSQLFSPTQTALLAFRIFPHHQDSTWISLFPGFSQLYNLAIVLTQPEWKYLPLFHCKYSTVVRNELTIQ